MPPAFFVPDDDGYRATEHTRGPWSPDLQHGGPPAALLAGVLERRAAASGMLVARLTVEFLRPIPIDRFTVRETAVRPGKKVMIHAASLLLGDDEVVRVTALCIRVATLAMPPPAVQARAPRSVEESPPFEFSFFRWDVGYHRAIEGRVASGAWGTGAMAVWMRTAVPIVEGEPLTPLTRVVVVADSGNGVSVALDLTQWTFVNPDLTVYLHRPAEGEWICLDAVTIPQPHGIGLAEAALYDAGGPIGRSLQSLIVQPR
jgi:hypothetical protein